jgi:hypothetical protein
MFKWTKRIVLGTVIVLGAGFLVFGTGVGSYMRSSGRMIKTAVKDSIPVEFEIQRARDLLEDLIPEMQANLRIVASEEVDVANLEKEIDRERDSVKIEGERIQGLRSTLKTQVVSYSISGREYSRTDLVDELARRFEQWRMAEILLQGKNDLLKNRKRSLDAAVGKLEKTRLARLELATQIESLEAQFRLVQSQSAGSEFRLDDTKLAQTNRVISDLKKRLEVTQRVLAREARFVENIPLDTVSEESLVGRVDAYFSRKAAPASPETAEAPVVAAETH